MARVLWWVAASSLVVTASALAASLAARWRGGWWSVARLVVTASAVSASLVETTSVVASTLVAW